MSSGNPFGLAEISHFGTFQRVGGKAGGFINKKFFHPSSLRNQEKLWKAQTADERESRKQAELEKQREEERQVETLRKQMYLAGQGKAGDFSLSAASEAASKLSAPEKSEQKLLMEEQKKRKSQLRKEQARAAAAAAAPGASPSASPDHDGSGASGDEADAGAAASASASQRRVLARSRYREDVHVNGHTSVWGSFYSTDDSKWGFSCCRTLARDVDCPNAEEQEAAGTETRGRKRRRGRDGAAGDGGAANGDGEAAAAATASSARAPPASVKELRAQEPTPESLFDERMVAAAEKRREQKRLEDEERKRARAKKLEEASNSSYLADLVQDPFGGS